MLRHNVTRSIKLGTDNSARTNDYLDGAPIISQAGSLARLCACEDERRDFRVHLKLQDKNLPRSPWRLSVANGTDLREWVLTRADAAPAACSYTAAPLYTPVFDAPRHYESAISFISLELSLLHARPAT